MFLLPFCLPFLTIWDHLGPFGTIWNNFGPFWNILDHFGPFETILDHFDHFLAILTIFFKFLFQFFFGRFDTSGSVLPRLVLEILILDAFCDAGAAAGAEIGDSRSWIVKMAP